MQDLQTAHEEFMVTSKEQSARLHRAEEKVKELEARTEAANKKAAKAEASLESKEAERKAAQSELDDLLMVFGDLEEKSLKYKDRLKALGGSVSDEEDDAEDGDEETEDDVD